MGLNNSQIESEHESEPESEPETNYVDNSFENWENATRHFHATIQSIMDIPIGETRHFLCLDRNVLDLAGDALNEYQQGDEATPSNVFGGNYHIKFTKTGEGITGKHYIVYNVDELEKSNDLKDEQTDFDVEYANNCWYPMEDGFLPSNDSQGVCFLFGTKRKWDSFLPTTRLGWRGPMIPLEKIDDIKIQF